MEQLTVAIKKQMSDCMECTACTRKHTHVKTVETPTFMGSSGIMGKQQTAMQLESME